MPLNSVHGVDVLGVHLDPVQVQPRVIASLKVFEAERRNDILPKLRVGAQVLADISLRKASRAN